MHEYDESMPVTAAVTVLVVMLDLHNMPLGYSRPHNRTYPMTLSNIVHSLAASGLSGGLATRTSALAGSASL